MKISLKSVEYANAEDPTNNYAVIDVESQHLSGSLKVLLTPDEVSTLNQLGRNILSRVGPLRVSGEAKAANG